MHKTKSLSLEGFARVRPLALLLILCLCPLGSGLYGTQTRSDEVETNDAGFRIEEPGTITFTTGVRIVGKVEKPEVVIFLPKEKPYLRAHSFDHTFKQDLLTPLPLTPVLPGDVP